MVPRVQSSEECNLTKRMSPVGSILWGLGDDSSMRMIVGNVIILDRPPSREALVARVTRAVALAPRLRQRPDASPGMRGRPSWIDDEFDAAVHVRTMAVASPGDQRQVLDLVALLEASPFDSNLSPWDVTLIEGLEGGRAALYLRAHHAVTDGLAGANLVRMLLDDQAGAPSPSEPATVAAPTEPATPTTKSVNDEGQSTRRRPGTVSVTIDLAGAIHPIASGVAAAMRIDPLDTVVRGVQRGLDVANSVSRQVVVTGGPLSALPPSRSINSRFEAFTVPGARTTALALGGSRNDLLVAAAAVGLGLYHQHLGLPCPQLRLASPSRWRSDAHGGGSVVPTRVEVPAENGPPGPLFGVVAERLARARREPALHTTQLLASAVSRMPRRLLMPLMRGQAQTVDFVATSLPGARGVRQICGALVEMSVPFGPRVGSLMNITGFGVDDRLDIGICLDPTAIAEPDLLVQLVQTAFDGFAPTHGS
jgi:diacylglycerol O-acyltransferase / wax synthase